MISTVYFCILAIMPLCSLALPHDATSYATPGQTGGLSAIQFTRTQQLTATNWPAQLGQLQGQIRVIQVQFTLVESNLQTVERRIPNWHISSLTAQFGQLSHQATDLRNRITACQTQLQGLYNQITEIFERLQNATSQGEHESQTEIDRCQKEVDTIRASFYAEVTTINTHITQYQATVVVLIGNLSQLHPTSPAEARDKHCICATLTEAQTIVVSIVESVLDILLDILGEFLPLDEILG